MGKDPAFTEEALDAALDRIEGRRVEREKQEARKSRGLVVGAPRYFKRREGTEPYPLRPSSFQTDLSIPRPPLPVSEIGVAVIRPTDVVELLVGDDPRQFTADRGFDEVRRDAVSEAALVTTLKISEFDEIQRPLAAARNLFESSDRGLAEALADEERKSEQLAEAKRRTAARNAARESASANLGAEQQRFDAQVSVLGLPVDALRNGLAGFMTLPSQENEIRGWNVDHEAWNVMSRRFEKAARAERDARWAAEGEIRDRLLGEGKKQVDVETVAACEINFGGYEGVGQFPALYRLTLPTEIAAIHIHAGKVRELKGVRS